MALSCCVQLGNRDARHPQYSNDIKKNSVHLKEGLTRRRASASRASVDNAATRAHRDAGNARAGEIGTCRYCKKCLCCSDFSDSCSTHSSRDESVREGRNVVNDAVRGLRVVNFGKEIIFVCNGMIARSRAPSITAVANHHPSIRNTSITPRASHATGLR